MKKIVFLSALLLFYFFETFSQENVVINEKEFKTSDKEGFKNAIKNIRKGDEWFALKKEYAFIEALNYYLEAYKYNDGNAQLNYKIGVCYLASSYKFKAIEYLEKSYQKRNSVASDVHWHLAKGYHYKMMFDEAIKEYTIYIKSLQPSEKARMQKIIEKRIFECKSGIELLKNPVNVVIDNLKNINSEYSEYCPLITADESSMFFTARKPDTFGKKRSEKDNQYFEDIYVSNNENDEWQIPENIGQPVNTNDYDATVGLSIDGQYLYTFVHGGIHYCKLNGDKWTSSKPLSTSINSPNDIQTSASFTPDGNTIYFIRGKMVENPIKSNRDIWICKKTYNGQWGKAVKLPSTINTIYDEDGVFIHPDGKTLFFSSRGHNSMGGYDVFVTQLKKDGTWTKPVNLGYPINTPDDDIYFTLSANGKHGYYSSYREEGLGYFDIYRITYYQPLSLYFRDEIPIDSIQLVNDKNDVSKSVKLTLIKGKVFNAEKNTPISAQIEIVDNDKNEIITTTTTNAKTGQFLVSLPSGKNYGFTVKSDGFLFYSQNFRLDENSSFNEVVTEIKMPAIAIDAKIILNNVFFETGESKLNSASFNELNRLYKFMVDNQSLICEISGHTDNQGDISVNQKLSEDRAKVVVDYLIAKGIPQKRLQAKGYGYTLPIASNETEEGRAKNRRVEFKILEK